MKKAFILAALIGFWTGAAFAAVPPYPAWTTPPTGAEIFICWQGGVTKNCQVNQVTGPVASNNAALSSLAHTSSAAVT